LIFRFLKGLLAFLDGFAEGFNLEYAHLSEKAAGPDPGAEDEDEFEDVSEATILEVVERSNDRFLARLDALDTILVGLFVATLAIAGIVLNKYSDLGHGIMPLMAASAASLLGLLFGNIFWRPVDSDPVNAILGLSRFGVPELVRLAEQIADGWRKRQWLRLVKLGSAALAMILLTVGTVDAIRENVISCGHEIKDCGDRQPLQVFHAKSQEGYKGGGTAPPDTLRDQGFGHW
jgi:hypothetical protein